MRVDSLIWFLTLERKGLIPHDLCLMLNVGVLYVPLIRFQNLFYISSLLIVFIKYASMQLLKSCQMLFFCISWVVLFGIYINSHFFNSKYFYLCCYQHKLSLVNVKTILYSQDKLHLVILYYYPFYILSDLFC